MVESGIVEFIILLMIAVAALVTVHITRHIAAGIVHAVLRSLRIRRQSA